MDSNEAEKTAANIMFDQPHICAFCASMGTPSKPLLFDWKIRKWVCPDIECNRKAEAK